MSKNISESVETAGLTKLGNSGHINFDSPSLSILEAFPNQYPQRDYVIEFDYPEFTSLCPKTGQPDFGTIIVRYVPNLCCVESKSFKLYMGSYRNQGAFMERLTNQIADDLIALLAPRRMTVEGLFNARGGTGIKVRVEHFDNTLATDELERLKSLW
ncbi:preQ(1) synthase [Desulfovibrio litoralis]|uniref:NADPH-dependent 7-cyano-7-deazaguanine reductase n=1 Tax=Desulfovibrio litoralis DSM 11393 TaxID=1121455 RepID=A0A1M7TIP3_9BACT|nr:preQ(1) synthase [Desulfovibrio litoralis]SHN70595.1 7-cyano-7-deazaguanine reductase [Desulfovibrio litoralis DSM 11393]